MFCRYEMTSTKKLVPKNFVHVLRIADIFRHYIFCRLKYLNINRRGMADSGELTLRA